MPANYLSHLPEASLLVTLASTLVFGAAVVFLAKAIYNRFEVGKPNEWLLIIKDGEMKLAGVGMTAYRSLGAQAVKFSSNVHKVEWKAQEMTNQRAGVEVKGFALWTVYRPSKDDPDGPFRAYKSIPGLSEGRATAGNEYVKQLTESIIRDCVANMSIMDVMQRRDHMRTSVRTKITPQLKGWGIWLETVEITDCRISSQSLFEDMQCLGTEQLNFSNRAAAKLSAETVRMSTQRQIDESQMETKRALDEKRVRQNMEVEEVRLKAEMEVALQRADADSRRQIDHAQNRLKVEKEEETLQKERDAIRMARLAQEKAIALAEVDKRAEIARAEATKSMVLQKEQAHHELALTQARIDQERQLTPVNLQKLHLDAVKEIYQGLHMGEVKLVNLSGGGGGAGGAGLASLLPGLAEVVKQVSEDTGTSNGH